jgi:hypothetical protein
MRYSLYLLLAVFSAGTLRAQDSTGLAGTTVQEVTSQLGNSPYLFTNWYSGIIRTADGKVHDGISLRYDLKQDAVEYKTGNSLYRLTNGITEFNIPTGIDLYIFKSGFPAVNGLTTQNFYRVLYDGNTKLLKRYTQPITIEKASPTVQMDREYKLFIFKDDRMAEVKLNDKNSFLKLLSDEKNKMLYIIKEQQLDFAAEDDLINLLQEYDAYKAGRGGN